MHPRWVIELLTGPKITFANLIGLVPGTGSGASSLAATLGGLLNPGHTWADIERIRSRWPGPTFVKGVMCAADAQRAVDAGCDGVIVSNHGGRQADGVAASIDVLPEVVAAIGDSGEVLFDGGVRRGGDIIKALALGARACLIGRPWLYGLGAEGLPGVERAIDILTAELDSTLALIGCASVADLSPSAIRRP
jgi:isopentenyl diphosphate isomerase/L-lactate dehydrogenase-like FMN-dependent dehydrogenase